MSKPWPLLNMILALLLCTGVVTAQSTITFWHWNTPDRHPHFEPYLQAFEKETGIKVEAVYVSHSALKEKLAIAIAAGISPDVVAVSSNWGEELGVQGAFVDLRHLIQRDNYGATDFFPVGFEIWQTLRGEQYAFPFDLDIKQMWYNKEVLDRTGVAYPRQGYTWRQWLDDATKIGRDTNGDGKPDQYAISLSWWNWLSLIPANDGQFFNADRTAHALRDSQSREAIEFWAQWWPNQRNTLLLGENVRANLAVGDVTAALQTGKVAFAGGGSYLASAVMWSANQAKWYFDFDVTGWPISNAGKQWAEVAGQGLAIPASSAQQEAAWLFIQYMTSSEVQRMIFGALGQFSVRRSVALSNVYFGAPGPPANKMAFIEGAGEYGRSFPKGVLWPQAQGIIRQALEQYCRGSMSLETAFTQLDVALKSILDDARGLERR